MIAYRSLLSLAFSQRLYWLNIFIPQRNDHLRLRRPFLISHRFWQRGFTVSPRSTIYRIYICGWSRKMQSCVVQKVCGLGPAHPRFVHVFSPAPHFVPNQMEALVNSCMCTYYFLFNETQTT